MSFSALSAPFTVRVSPSNWAWASQLFLRSFQGGCACLVPSLFSGSAGSCSPARLACSLQLLLVSLWGGGGWSAGNFSRVVDGGSLLLLRGHSGEPSTVSVVARDVFLQSDCFHRGGAGLPSHSSQRLFLCPVQSVQLGRRKPGLPTRRGVIQDTLLCG